MPLPVITSPQRNMRMDSAGFISSAQRRLSACGRRGQWAVDGVDIITIHYPLAICQLSHDLNLVDHLIHAEDEPGVELRHVFLAFASHNAFQSNDAIARGDEDLNVVYERVLVQYELDGVGYFAAVVLFRRDDLQAVENVAAARNP